MIDWSMTAYRPLSVLVPNNYNYRFCARVMIFSLSASLCSRNDMKIKILELYFRSSKECPEYRGFPAPKTKFLHMPLSVLSLSVRPWLVALRLTPVIHPFWTFPSFSSLYFFFYVFRGSLLPGILFMCPNWRNRFPQLLQIYYSVHL
jgi:hypothetical protein